MNNILLLLSFWLLCFCPSSLLGQTSGSSFKYKAVVVDSFTNQPLSFAAVVSKSNNSATITSLKGYFELKTFLGDSLVISYIGYRTRVFPIDQINSTDTIQLQAQAFELEAVEVKAKDYSFLFDLIEECKNNTQSDTLSSKAYYQLKSYIKGRQIELVESFYNAEVKGYDLKDLALKNGRLGLRQMEGSFFSSLESSKPIQKHKLLNQIKFFPLNPLAEGRSRMQRNCYIEFTKRYNNEEGDSIFVVYLYPKKNREKHFDCKLWINASKKLFSKIHLEAVDPNDFPLMPTDPNDKLLNKHLEITKTFKLREGKAYFEHVDFNYDFLYSKHDGKDFNVHTEAVLYTYDDTEQFKLPIWEGFATEVTDYQALGALPENSFFWEFNDELKVNEQIDSNQIFMDDPMTVTNSNYRSSTSSLAQYFNYSCSPWQKRRLFFKVLPKQTKYIEGEGDYLLSAGFFVDVNLYQDSLNIFSVALFDAYRSFYRYTIDATAICFFNMYFDLVEMRHMDFVKEISRLDDGYHRIDEKYKEYAELMRIELNLFENDVERGRNLYELKQWNKKIKKHLGIDNVEIYKLDQEEEN